jgi:hypothetical protein
MDILLIVVSIVSAVVALAMTGVAWRVSRNQRAASAARVAALSAAAAMEADRPGEKPSHTTPLEQFETEPVGASRQSPWKAARVSAFGAGARTAQPIARTAPPEATTRPATIELSSDRAVLGEGFLGSTVSPATDGGRQRSLAVAAIVLFGLVLAGGYWAVFVDRSATATVSAPSTTSPLELVSMRHERRGTRLAVTGLVRNPVAGAPVERLAAVVFLFDQQGGFISSARANVDFLKLTPGDESPFVIDVEAPSNVTRYRVSFRNDAGIVPHVDRRGQQPLALTTVR